jgi:hypothetical protein
MHSSKFQAVKSTRGASLIVTLGLTLVLLLLASGVTALVSSFAKTTKRVEQANVAYLAAEAGIELALYDLAAYKDGYETDRSQHVCGTAPSGQLTRTADFDTACTADAPYRFINFTDSAESGGRAFWRIFNQALREQPADTNFVIPNPYFAGDKDGMLDKTEWGRLTKAKSLGLSLAIDADPSEADPANRFLALPTDTNTKIIFEIGAGETWNPTQGSVPPGGTRSASDEDVFTWTLSAVDGLGEEYTLQGLVWESDFTQQDCDGDGEEEICFIFDLQDAPLVGNVGLSGYPLAGEDINKNLTGSTYITSFNRVSAVNEEFPFNTIPGFLTDLNAAYAAGTAPTYNQAWHDARLSFNLIGALSEAAGVESDSLLYKVLSLEPIADEYAYIVSEGFAGSVKQTIETRFRRQATLSIFSYVIFQ